MFLHAGYSRGQVKIQQMAFVLVALVLFFVLVGLFVLLVSSNSLREKAELLREAQALEQVRKLATSPEFAFTAAGDCESCIDLDKVFALKERTSYKEFWKLPMLQVIKISNQEECTKTNYPNCGSITLAGQKENVIAKGAFVALCRYSDKGYSCELGKIIAGFETTS